MCCVTPLPARRKSESRSATAPLSSRSWMTGRSGRLSSRLAVTGCGACKSGPPLLAAPARRARSTAPGGGYGPASRWAEGIVMAPIRVLVADDHALVRAGFSSILSDEDDIEVVGE